MLFSKIYYFQTSSKREIFVYEVILIEIIMKLHIIQKKLLITFSFICLSLVAFNPNIAKGQTHHSCVNSIANWSVAKVYSKKKPKYWIDPKFTRSERIFIEKALKIAVDRFQEKSIWQTVRSSYGFANPKNETITNAGFCNNINIRRNLLFHQLYSLSATNPENAKREFPNIYIYHSNTPPKRGTPGWVGYAYYNKVSVYWNFQTRRWERSGNFQLYLNQFFLQKSGIYKSEDYWAGTIAHEMLHNLGHQHPDASNKKYQSFQINVLANAVRDFGRVESAGEIIKYPVHTCRLKSTGRAETAGDV